MVAVTRHWVFQGHIAGFGTESGLRAVVGIWASSPFGAFADAMVELPSGQRLLLAPRPDIADFIQTTYTFDDVVLEPVQAALIANHGEGQLLTVQAGPLSIEAQIGGPTRLGRLMALVPPALGVHPWWLTLINPVAAVLSPGVRTAGMASQGRREFYGVTGLHTVNTASIAWKGRDAGPLADISPGVRFGFSSVPATPALATIQTTIMGVGQMP
ncbi:hypothetical protein [Arthrobacter sp.]|uniref:hypothetical protein n=1 Tax=Arthrobacter sp. TaxID=1667 RepID=UPI0026DEFC54|nr:hypothetical protein [Arthrobacter sp.]MDO5752036.1 hypothetical protein [Arthrobacter sp.]